MKCHLSIRSLLISVSLIAGIVLLAVPALAAALGGSYALDWFAIVGGGGSAAGGAYSLAASIGQPVAGTQSGGAYTMHVGFLPEVSPSPVTATLGLEKLASAPTVGVGQAVTFTLRLTATDAPVPSTLTDTLPLGMSYVPGSVTGGATYDPATRQIRFSGSVAPGSPLDLSYRITVDANVRPGSVLANAARVTYTIAGKQYQLERSVAVSLPAAATVRNLVLIYANGDNNLSGRMTALLNNAEVSAGNPNAVVLLLLDGPGRDDARLYRLQSDSDASCPNFANPTCDGRYVMGENLWEWSDDTANPYSLAEFLKGGMRAYPDAAQVIVSLVGHGSGWYPDLVPGQPSAWDGQPGGLLWDETPAPGSYLTTKGLGDALRWATLATGRKIDLLDLDACLMAMSEVAYEVSDSAEVLLASENWSWAAFPYDAYLSPNVLDSTATPAEIGTTWLEIQANLLRSESYPFTLALIDEHQMLAVRSSVASLAQALRATLPAGHDKLVLAHTPGICFDSSQDQVIDSADNICDLAGLARHIAIEFAGTATVVNAAQSLQSAVASAVVVEAHQGGVPHSKTDTRWDWEELGGLSIYAPLRLDDWKRAYYNGRHLAFAEGRAWGDLLDAFWGVQPPPVCTGAACPLPPAPIAPAPINAQARAGHEDILLTWSSDAPITGLAGYHVLRQITGTSFITLTTAPINVSQYADSAGLSQDTTYCYQIKAVNAGGSIVGESGVACARFGELTLWIPEITAPISGTVGVPVNAGHGDGLCIGALQVWVRYDPTIATATGVVTPTIYSSGYGFTANTTTPGQVAIAAIDSSCMPLYGPGTLFTIGFDTHGADGQSGSLDFITGVDYTVIYDDSDLASPVPLQLENGRLRLGSTYVRGDVNGDVYINVADALLALRISSGQLTPSPRQVSACDVNGDAACSSADATLILCYSVNRNWEGCGAGAASVGAACVQTPAALSNVTRIRVTSSGVDGAVITSLAIANGQEMAGGTFTFQYDPSQMTFESASASSATNGFSVQSYVPQAGLVRVALARRTAIGADGAVLELRFRSTGNSSQVRMSDVRLNDSAGRDFVTSALQKQIIIETGRRLFLPVIVRQ